MSRVPLHTADTAPAASQPLLAEIQGAFGATPNMFRAVANSPAALKQMWAGFGALRGGSLPAKLGEQVAVAIANRNACEYCLAAHTALGRKAGASAEEMAEAQSGRSTDPQTAAALAFALKVVERRADVDATDVQALRTLVRNARKEAQLGKPPKSSRELFQAVKQALASRTLGCASSAVARSCRAVSSRLRCDLLLGVPGSSSSPMSVRTTGCRYEGLWRDARLMARIVSCYDGRLS